MAIEDKVNEILGLEPAKTPVVEEKEFKAPVARTTPSIITAKSLFIGSA